MFWLFAWAVFLLMLPNNNLNEGYFESTAKLREKKAYPFDRIISPRAN